MHLQKRIHPHCAAIVFSFGAIFHNKGYRMLYGMRRVCGGVPYHALSYKTKQLR